MIKIPDDWLTLPYLDVSFDSIRRMHQDTYNQIVQFLSPPGTTRARCHVFWKGNIEVIRYYMEDEHQQVIFKLMFSNLRYVN